MVVYISNADNRYLRELIKEVFEKYTDTKIEIIPFKCSNNPFKFVILKPTNQNERMVVNNWVNRIKRHFLEKGIKQFFVLVY